MLADEIFNPIRKQFLKYSSTRTGTAMSKKPVKPTVYSVTQGNSSCLSGQFVTARMSAARQSQPQKDILAPCRFSLKERELISNSQLNLAPSTSSFSKKPKRPNSAMNQSKKISKHIKSQLVQEEIKRKYGLLSQSGTSSREDVSQTKSQVLLVE